MRSKWSSRTGDHRGRKVERRRPSSCSRLWVVCVVQKGLLAVCVHRLGHGTCADCVTCAVKIVSS